MTGQRSSGPRADRRGVLAAAAAAAFGGCSAVTDADPGPDGDASADGPRAAGDGLEEARAGLASVYARLESVPVADDGEFVFDVGAFEAEFDHEAVLADVEAVRERIEAHDADAGARERAALATAADVAAALVRQRLHLHQALAAGAAYEERFGRAEFGRAAAAVRDGRESLERVGANGERVEALLDRQDGPAPGVEGYDPATIRDAQSVLVSVARWTGPAYEGLGPAAEGFDAFAAANDAMERERFGTAADRFGRARDRFEAAEAALDRAAGRGRRVGYLAPTVEEVRCVVPAYVDGCDRLADALADVDAGDRSRGFDVARATLEEMDRSIARCLEAVG